MPYCSYCGVEVDRETVTCPLCAAPIPAASDEPPLYTGAYPKSDNRLRYSRRPFTAHERRVVLWLFSFILAVPLTIVVAVDFYLSRSISWSVFPIVGFAGVWIIVAFALFLRGMWRLFISYFLLAFVLSFLFNHLAGATGAFLDWNMPIILMAAFLTLACAYYGSRVERLGANLAAVILWALTLFCFGIDALITLRLGQEGVPLGWSLIVASALVPTGALLMYIHYHFGRTFSVRRYFNA
jgi:hypothetical protein